MKKNIHGFTLVEIILAISVLGILAAIVTVGLSGFQTSSSNTVRSTEVKQWASTFDLYKSRFGTWPVLPKDDSSPVTLCLGDFSSVGGKCGNLSSQSYTVDDSMLQAIETVGKQPENTAPSVSDKVAGPVAYMSQKTTGGVSTVTVKYVGFFKGASCPADFTEEKSTQSKGIINGASDVVACELNDRGDTFAYKAGTNPAPASQSSGPSSAPTPTPVATPVPTPTPTPVATATPKPTATPIPAPIPVPSTTKKDQEKCYDKSNNFLGWFSIGYCTGLVATGVATSTTLVVGGTIAAVATLVGGPLAGAAVVGVTLAVAAVGVVAGVAQSVVAGVVTAAVGAVVSAVTSFFNWLGF